MYIVVLFIADRPWCRYTCRLCLFFASDLDRQGSLLLQLVLRLPLHRYLRSCRLHAVAPMLVWGNLQILQQFLEFYDMSPLTSCTRFPWLYWTASSKHTVMALSSLFRRICEYAIEAPVQLEGHVYRHYSIPFQLSILTLNCLNFGIHKETLMMSRLQERLCMPGSFDCTDAPNFLDKVSSSKETV